MKTYIFVVDTEKYSGNFEREMVAYMTGFVNECNVGKVEADIFKKEVNNKKFKYIDNILIEKFNDHDRLSPLAIWPTPGWYNNGSGQHFRNNEGPKKNKWPAYMSVALFLDRMIDDEEIGFLADRAMKFQDYLQNHIKKYKHCNINITDFRIIEEETTTTTTLIRSFKVSP